MSWGALVCRACLLLAWPEPACRRRLAARVSGCCPSTPVGTSERLLQCLPAWFASLPAAQRVLYLACQQTLPSCPRSYVDGLVGACTDLGFSACVTVAALNGTGNDTVLVDQEQRWAGQAPIRPRPSWPTVEPPANFNTTAEQWALGIQALCLDYNASAGEWQNGTMYGELQGRWEGLIAAGTQACTLAAPEAVLLRVPCSGS